MIIKTIINNRNTKVVHIFAFMIIIFLGGLYFFSHKTSNIISTKNLTVTPTMDSRPYIIFQKTKVMVGEYLYLPRPTSDYPGQSKRVTGERDALFLLVEVDKDAVIIRSEDGKVDTIKDKSCLPISQGGPVYVSDIFYKYCFSFDTIDSVLNIKYELITERWNGKGTTTRK